MQAPKPEGFKRKALISREREKYFLSFIYINYIFAQKAFSNVFSYVFVMSLYSGYGKTESLLDMQVQMMFMEWGKKIAGERSSGTCVFIQYRNVEY